MSKDPIKEARKLVKRMIKDAKRRAAMPTFRSPFAPPTEAEKATREKKDNTRNTESCSFYVKGWKVAEFHALIAGLESSYKVNGFEVSTREVSTTFWGAYMLVVLNGTAIARRTFFDAVDNKFERIGYRVEGTRK